MELNVEKKEINCLDTVVREVQNLELTQELRLPDGLPDIGRIISTWGQVVLRSKEWHSDTISCSAGMMIWILYAPEDGGQERCLDTWIPFQMHWDLPEQTPEGKMRIRFLTRFTDGRSVSPRKIMLRAGVAALAEAFVPTQRVIDTFPDVPEGMYLLECTYPVRLGREAGEKTFLLDEELVLPESAPQPDRIISFRMRPNVFEKRILGNKLVFRGNGNLHVIYRSEEGQLYNWDFELPFSQFAELEQELSTDAQADLALLPTSLELELDDESHLRLKCGITGQYYLTDKLLLTLAEDCYSLEKEWTEERQELLLPAILESRQDVMAAEQTISADAVVTVDVQFSPDFPKQKRSEMGMEMTVPGVFQILYYDADRQVHSASVRWEGQQRLPADECCCFAVVPYCAEAAAVNGNGQALLKTELQLDTVVSAEQQLPALSGISLGERRELDSRRPALILQRAGKSRLWDIAKNCGSTVNAIRQANQLQGEPQPDQMLLIPVK